MHISAVFTDIHEKINIVFGHLARFVSRGMAPPGGAPSLIQAKKEA